MQLLCKSLKKYIFISHIKISAFVPDYPFLIFNTVNYTFFGGNIFCLYGTSPPLAYIYHYKFTYLYLVNYFKILEVLNSFNGSLIKASHSQS
ncbi:hypothetical protein MACJ_003416 [Theileria orientalis]|uniref:Uncharacterized protein n=1 Tax=Theileria orientalis TaxID=68886 RepID=A0A976SK94_THEOR|nr:hypothetical protein MACJ_003416 [Theileria orientalis]